MIESQQSRLTELERQTLSLMQEYAEGSYHYQLLVMCVMNINALQGKQSPRKGKRGK